MVSDLELGLSALHLASLSRRGGMTILWLSLWFSFLLPSSATPVRMPTTQPPESVSSEAAFLEDYVLGMGDTLEMSCELEGPSEPIVWFKDGVGVVPSNRTLVGQRILRIINVSYEDSGMYTCWLAHTNMLLSNFTIRITDSLSSGDDEDYGDDPDDGGNGNVLETQETGVHMTQPKDTPASSLPLATTRPAAATRSTATRPDPGSGLCTDLILGILPANSH